MLDGESSWLNFDSTPFSGASSVTFNGSYSYGITDFAVEILLFMILDFSITAVVRFDEPELFPTVANALVSKACPDF